MPSTFWPKPSLSTSVQPPSTLARGSSNPSPTVMVIVSPVGSPLGRSLGRSVGRLDSGVGTDELASSTTLDAVRARRMPPTTSATTRRTTKTAAAMRQPLAVPLIPCFWGGG